MNEPADRRYESGAYWTDHPEWLAEASTPKVQDMLPSFRAALEARSGDSFVIADVGTGTGASIQTIARELTRLYPKTQVRVVGYEIAPNAIAAGRERFPEMEFRQKHFDGTDGTFDAVSFLDVLEHVEDPYGLMRSAAKAAPFMVVRQPLLEGFSSFRHNAYINHINGEGHITFFNCRSFVAMANFSGWLPLHTELLAPWQQAGNSRNRGLFKSLLHKINPELASIIISGYYLNGAFRRKAT